MKVQEMRKVRKRLIESQVQTRLMAAELAIRKEVTSQVLQVEYTQQRRELNQRLRELATQLAAQTNFENGREVRRSRKTWCLVKLFRLHGRDYHLSSHGHLMYEDWDAEYYGWQKWVKVRHGNTEVTNRQMMTLIARLERHLN